MVANSIPKFLIGSRDQKMDSFPHLMTSNPKSFPSNKKLAVKSKCDLSMLTLKAPITKSNLLECPSKRVCLKQSISAARRTRILKFFVENATIGTYSYALRNSGKSPVRDLDQNLLMADPSGWLNWAFNSTQTRPFSFLSWIY